MAAEESTAMSYEKIYDMGTGLIIAKVQLDKVREQDINARIMKKEMQDQLTAHQERPRRRHEGDYRHHRRERPVPLQDRIEAVGPQRHQRFR